MLGSDLQRRHPRLAEGKIATGVLVCYEGLQSGKRARLELVSHRPGRAAESCSKLTCSTWLQQRIYLLQGAVLLVVLLAWQRAAVNLALACRPMLDLRVDQLNICFDPEHLLSQIRQWTRCAVVAAFGDGREAR